MLFPIPAKCPDVGPYTRLQPSAGLVDRAPISLVSHHRVWQPGTSFNTWDCTTEASTTRAGGRLAPPEVVYPQAGPFSAVSSAFDVSKLELDPNAMSGAYMRTLIHAVNSSLFPNTDPDSATRAEPPPEIVIVQTLLHASLATSLFAAFLVMLRKQRVDRYVRNRERKLDGLEKLYPPPRHQEYLAMLRLASSCCSAPSCPGIYGRPAALSLGSPLL